MFFCGLLALLVIPLMNSYVKFIPEKALSGGLETKPDTTLSISGWFSGKYQVKKDIFLKDSFGCRRLFIRVHNQVIYSLADKQTVMDVVIGKNGYSYSLGQVENYSGESFPGVKNIADEVDKMKFIQDTLAKLHKTFVLILAPGVPTYEPAYLPDKYVKHVSMNAYDCYAALLKPSGINYIDFNKYFLDTKNTLPYKAFTFNSLHWTKYGSDLAGDSILHFIENKGKYKLNHPHWDSIVFSEADGTEIENEEDMNLIFKLKREKLGHPHLTFKPDTGAGRPSALFIGDSFFWGLQRVFNIWDAFSSSKFMPYYRKVYTKGDSAIKIAAKVNLRDEINKDDIVIIICSEGNYHRLGWGFIDDLYKMFKTGETPQYAEYHRKINELKTAMKNDPQWFHSIEVKAKDKKIPVDSMMTLDAIWMIENR